jgi:hypothetical protein
MSSDGNIHG